MNFNMFLIKIIFLNVFKLFKVLILKINLKK
jgi:hypothetical protein